MRTPRPAPPATATCAACGYGHDDDAVVCSLCGALLGQPTSASARPRPIAEPAVNFDSAPPPEPTIAGVPASLAFLILGAVLAPIFTWTPILQYMGWFLGSLTHEMGHCVAAWVGGCPAYPAIRLDGHAAAVHQEQNLFVVAVVWTSLAYAAWSLRARRGWLIACALGLVVQPIVAFTWLGELLHLAAGHLGEAAFATICFVRVLDGGFTKSATERAAYAMLGWYLVGRNLWLHLGLTFSAERRDWYEGSGSFGLANDLTRIATDVLSCRIEPVGFVMALLCATPLALAWLIWRVRGAVAFG